MSALEKTNPFHKGELEAQTRAGVGNVAEWAGAFIRDFLPEQHREFHTSLPFLVAAGSNEKGQTWVTLVEGEDGFATSPDPHHLTLATSLDPSDPLSASFQMGADVGFLGIELDTRRRNRFSGYVQSSGSHYMIDIRQTFGNCPQYINERAWKRVNRTAPANVELTNALTERQIAQIENADTLFIGSGTVDGKNDPSRGFDASHRGGAPGFVHVVDSKHLQIPDYAGNNFFNTIGNLISNPRIGLLFIDFETGGLLHISGRATIDWKPNYARDLEAKRVINVQIDAVLDRPKAVSLRWEKPRDVTRRLRLSKRVKESEQITSFYLTPADGQPLEPFKAGQHLPIEVPIFGQIGNTKRSYSLSGSPHDDGYRLSIKREEKGLMSRYFHDRMNEGDVIDTHKPSGDFLVPNDNAPLVLASAGVGLTPMISMLHATAGENRPVHFIHGVRDGRDHALREEVDTLVSQHENLSSQVFYSRPDDRDILGQDYDVKGRVSAQQLMDMKVGPEAHYLLCGPSSFIADIRNGLEKLGVSSERIHFETF